MLLREASDAVEADLQRFYGVDLADYWRGGLSIRRLSVFLSNLPPDSAVHRRYSSTDGWQTEHFLLADLFHAFTGEAHPSRPQIAQKSRYSELRRKLEAQKARLHTP